MDQNIHFQTLSFLCKWWDHRYLVRYLFIGLSIFFIFINISTFYFNLFKKFFFEEVKLAYISWHHQKESNLRRSTLLRVCLVREFWRGGEIFNLKCMVQFLEWEGEGEEQILLHCQNYPCINLKSQYYPCNNIYFYYVILSLKHLLLLLGYRLYYLVTTFIPYY